MGSYASFFYLSAAGGEQKFMKNKHFFFSRKNKIINIHAVFFIVSIVQRLHLCKWVTQFAAVTSEEFHFKILALTPHFLEKLPQT